MTYYLIELEATDGNYRVIIFDDMEHINKYVKREKLHKDDYTVIHGELQHHSQQLFAMGRIE